MNQTSDPILEFKNLCFHYEKNRPVLQNLSLSIYPEEKVALLGNNGAGKSTFFLCCNGVLKPCGGEIFFHGNYLNATHKELITLRKNVGVVFQDPDDQIIASTVEGEVSFGPLNLGLSMDETSIRVDKSLQKTGLSTFRTRHPHSLSGGEKKRVSIADILAMEPELILFDEPASSLDPENAAALEDTLEELNRQGISVVISTHDVDFAWRWANRVLVLHNGNLLADSTPQEVFDNEPLLQKSGLKKPMLYELTEVLCNVTKHDLPHEFPKTTTMFSHLAKTLL